MDKNGQNDFPLPTSVDRQENRQTSRHLPAFFRSDSNQKFLGGTLDPLTQPGKLTRINAYVGRRDIPNYSFDDTYVVENSVPRTYYQLENSFINENPVTGEVRWYADYIDYINSLKYFGAPTGNHSRLNSTEAYAWDPHVNWDKLVNFREYYWLPNGPEPVTILGELESTVSTYTVTAEDQGDTIAYLFTPDGLTVNPRLTLYKGIKYRFNINTPGKPFCIKTQPKIGDSFFYNVGISEQRVEKGVIEFDIPYEAPDLLYYIDNNDPDTAGMIDVRDIQDSAFLDVDAEIVGKKNFKSSTGVEFVNGLKIKFAGQVFPEKYADGFWYVEGVGDKIKLIKTSDLETPAVYGANLDVPFDDQPFDSLPWDNADNYPLTKDYIVVDRSSQDRNTWSRNNRWFHRNVLETAASANGTIASLDQEARAIRPIIEFEPNIKLYANGYVAKKDVDLVDTFTTDVFSTIEGSTGYIIDGESILSGYRILFAADTDILVRGKIFEVKFIFNANENKRQITLIEVDDTDPQEGEVVYVTKGNSKGQGYYYEEGNWYLAQKKVSVNQAPLYDLFDNNGISYSNKAVYPYNSFTGNRIFGYKIGSGSADSELGFALTYRNINNIGDIEFEFDLQSRNWTYQDQNQVVEIESATAFVRKYVNSTSPFVFSNGWTFANRKSEQRVVRVLRVDTATDLVAIDVYDNSASLPDLNLRVYVNDKKRNDLSLELIEGTAYIKFSTPLAVGDKVVYKARSLANKNAKGFYEIPTNWQNNPLNDSVNAFTFGEVTDHVKTIIENLPVADFTGDFPGISNLNNIGPLSHYGRRFMQYPSPFGLSAFSMVDKDANIVKSLRWAAKKYSEFKKEFLRIVEQNGFDGSISDIVDQALLKYSEARYIDTFAFYFSDMAPYGAASIREYTVVDPRLPAFVIDSIFDRRVVSKRSVLVYLNDVQLISEKDYNFDLEDAFLIVYAPLSAGDKITIKDYASTDGCYIPFTPSKLGIYPIYEPMKFLDDTYREPTLVIQGHDGSIIKAYNDYRDDIILELEKRIFNTKRVVYNSEIFDINSVLGSYYRRGEFTKAEINNVLLTDFLKWNNNLTQDFSTNDYYSEEDTFTYNYNRSVDPSSTETLHGFWRGIYKYFYDTDRPHTHPWEMQGFYIKPTWWDEVYGVAPYTSENKIMWDAIEQGLINDPTNTRVVNRYARPGLSAYIPVDEQGNLLSPLDSNLAQDFSLTNGKGPYKFGDHAPVETAWRRSSEYPYAITVLMCVLKGAEFIGKMWDRFTIGRNIAGQIYYALNGKRVQTSTLPYPDLPLGDPNDPTVPTTFTQGLVNFIDEYVFIERSINLDYYKELLSGLNTKLSYRLGGFTSKEKIKVLLDSRSPNASGTVFLPEENYKIFYNKSAPVDTVSYSGVIVEKLGSSYEPWAPNKRYTQGKKVTFQKEIYRCLTTHVSNNAIGLDDVARFALDSENWIKETVEKSGFRITGYDIEKNYFEIYQPKTTFGDPTINVGGVSETYVNWKANAKDPDPTVSSAEKTAEQSRIYYNKGQIAKVGDSFYRAIVSHTASENFDLDADKWQRLAKLPLVGGRTAIRRKRFDTITPVKIPYGTILNDIQSVVDFLLGYQARLVEVGFEFDDYSKDLSTPLDWLTSAKEFMFWTLQAWAAGSIITLSPSASLLKFKPKIKAAVDNLDADFYEYSIFKADGQPLKADLTNIFRKDNGFTVKPTIDTNDGIFHIRSNLVYKEHVILFDNVSIFNDVVYDVVPGYRQGRLKLVGFKTNSWNGGLQSPGFLYDEAKIQDWQPNVDYNLGDIVGYKNYYFSAVKKILGKADFDYNDWKQIEEKPIPGLIPNFDYKVEQFRDFYSLEGSNFDDTQTKLARHLIGYEKRKYLEDVIIDDVSQFKFYQGFIKEKGSNNSIIKLFDALRASGISTIDVREEWAFKVGDYGASEAYTEIEFSLDEEKFLFNPQDIVLTPNKQEFEDLTIYNVTSNMVSLKPSSYDSNPFTMKKIDPSQNDYGIFKYRVAGYVRDDDVDHVIYNESALLNYDIEQFKEGDRIWLGYKSNNDWDVLRVTNTKVTVTNWNIEENTITLECNLVPDLAKDDIIILKNLDSINGTYKIQRVYNNFVEIFTFNNSVFKLEEDSTTGILIKLESIRFDDPAQLSLKRYNENKIYSEKVWIDRDAEDRWLVLENIDAFTESELPAFLKTSGQQHGYEVKISANKLWMLVSAPTNSGGKVIVYNRPNNISKWSFVQTLLTPTDYISSGGTEQFGISIDIVENGTLLVVTAPNASNLRSYFKGNYNTSATYYPGDIVKYSGQFRKAKNTVVGDGSTVTVNGFDWEQVYIYEGDKTGSGSGFTNQGVAFVFAYDKVSKRFEIESVLGSYEPTSGEKFGSKVRITNDGNNVWMFVSSKNHNSDTGRVQVFKRTSAGWEFNSQRFLDFSLILGPYQSIYTPSAGSQYGYDLDCTEGADRIVVSAPFITNASGAVYVFDRSGSDFELVQVVDRYTLINGITQNLVGGDSYISENDYFGYSVKISPTKLFVSVPNDDLGGYNAGSVYFFENTGGDSSGNPYRLKQLIKPPLTFDNERFGTKLGLSASNSVLTVSAIGGDSIYEATFDTYSDRISFDEDSTKNYELDKQSEKLETATTFDGNSTKFYDRIAYTGAVYVFNGYDQNYIYADKLRPSSDLASNDSFGFSISVTDDCIAVGTPNRLVNNESYGTVFIFDYKNLSWNTIASQNELVDVTKFKKAFIYNTAENKLIANLDFIDPAKGRIPGVADQEIKYQTYYDPAVYEYGVESEVSVDRSGRWTDDHVGELWWDLSKVKFTWYEQGDSTYRNNNWGKIFPGSSIDIYEWVESTYQPSRWAVLADTEEGLALGISGIPKDIDDFTYSSKFKYDSVAGTKTTLYYFWVKNKTTVPRNSFRSLSGADVARLIFDPKSQGYKFISITDSNSLSLTNISNRLINTDVSLNVQFYTIENTSLLTHREYVLIAKDDRSANIPPILENKWFDSLIGYNVKGQPVPDRKLNQKQKYGTSNAPRQTWFMNRYEALKQLFEYINGVLRTKQVVDEINFTNLLKKDVEPSITSISTEVDVEVDILDDLRFVGIANVKTASLSVSVSEGKISNVFVIDGGYGYGRNKVYEEDVNGNPIKWYGPKVKILGTGTDAEIISVVNNQGKIVGAHIIRSGKDYDTNSTTLSVRGFAVLVKVDEESNGGWSVHSWDSSKKRWIRTRTQAYDVTRYWRYKDWYATGYGLDSDISYLVDRTVDLNGLPAVKGDIVKVNDVGYGTWLLLERRSVTNSPDFTDDYVVVGKQGATIEFSSGLYNQNGDIGFDITSSFDLSPYDQTPTTELRIIMQSLRDDILVDDLRIEYIRSFFNSVYYAFSEQTYLDWAFKTSFLKINHNVGSLKKRVTFQSDVLDSYQSYIEETKPYKSKIREFVSSYERIEESNHLITDFDLPAYYYPELGRIERTTETSSIVNTYPWKNWLDNHTYELVDIILNEHGSNYTSRPKVLITGGGLDLTNPLHRSATATAYVANGKVYKIIVDDPGYGYKSTPTVFISGGNGDVEETRAKAYAVLGNSKVRTNHIVMKYDRYTNSYEVGDFQYQNTFTGATNQTSFKLTYAPEIEKTKINVVVDNIEYYSSQYDVSIIQAVHDTYTTYEGSIVFKIAPPVGSQIVITYYKNIRIYGATDRINYAYNPKSGQYGKDLGQLMTGVDYGGTVLTSIDFEIGGGWDVLPWDVSSWDNVITSNDDYVVASDGTTTEFELPYVPAIGEVINIYLNDVRIDDFYFDLYDGSTVQENGRTTAPEGIVMNSFVGNGIDNVISIPLVIDLVPTDLLTFRKSTSDGTILPTDRSLIDSLISGGDLAYSSARGILAEEIIVDGDGFVTVDTSHGPEELVQGQVLDSLDIKVFHTPSAGGPNVVVRNYIGDGTTDTFDIGQLPSTSTSLFVLVNDVITDYTVNMNNLTVTISPVPTVDSQIGIISLDTAGYDILDKVVFYGDGSTKEFLTAAPYVFNLVDDSARNVSAFVTLDGVPLDITLKESDESYEASGYTIVEFDTAPVVGSVIQIMIFAGNIQKWSQVTTQVIPVVPGQFDYDLDPLPAFLSPLTANVFVVVDGEFLQAPDYEHFVYDGNTIFIDDLRYGPNTLRLPIMDVYKNRVRLIPIQDYDLDSGQSSITISPGVATIGDEITIEIFRSAHFRIIDGKLAISNTNYTVNNKQTIKATVFTNHDILKTKISNVGFRFNTGFDALQYDVTKYDTLSAAINTSGIFDLPRTVSNTSGVFVALNKVLLTPNIDYVVLDNKRQIKVLLPALLQGEDYIEIITFNDKTVRPSYGFKIFKDMVNRYHYKRVDDQSTTALKEPLSITDTKIVVHDASVLSEPSRDFNLPGVIEIHGERIEYFVKEGNTLRQIRRSTLGTGAEPYYEVGSIVRDIGQVQSIPYVDTEVKKTFFGDGSTQMFELDFALNPTVGTIDDGSTDYTGWYRETIPSEFGQCDEIEVFVAGRRLRKNPVTIYDPTLGQDSYQGAGDKQVEAEFSVGIASNHVRLTVAPEAGDRIVIVKRQGRLWQKRDENSSLVYSNTNVARFLTAKPVSLPK